MLGCHPLILNCSSLHAKVSVLIPEWTPLLKFTKHFWSNRNHFPVDYYFRPYQTPENTEIIFQKSFYAETNGA
jgi:hypothetical protein